MFELTSGLFIAVFSIGVIAGALINHLIYALPGNPSQISSWQQRPEQLGPLRSWERIPMVGWLLRSRRFDDANLYGRWFWIRPFLIELITPWMLVALFVAAKRGDFLPSGVSVDRYYLPQFIAYSILLFLLAIATFIDFDELIIPDEITVPGTIIGLMGSTFFEGWNWIERVQLLDPPFTQVVRSLHACSPEEFPRSWEQRSWIGLFLALAAWSIWCLSLVDFLWIRRRGLRKAFEYAWAGYWRGSNRIFCNRLLILGVVAITVAFFWLNSAQWQRLQSALVGMWLAGFLLWAFRMVAHEVLKREALGFGDVTLMSMVGAFFGWQIGWIAFFLAPLFGIAIALIKFFLTGDEATPFGPYLTAACVYLMIDWQRVWEACREWMIPATSAVWMIIPLLILLGGLLKLIVSIRQKLSSLSPR